jgi:hypothetical protein
MEFPSAFFAMAIPFIAMRLSMHSPFPALGLQRLAIFQLMHTLAPVNPVRWCASRTQIGPSREVRKMPLPKSCTAANNDAAARSPRGSLVLFDWRLPQDNGRD